VVSTQYVLVGTSPSSAPGSAGAAISGTGVLSVSGRLRVNAGANLSFSGSGAVDLTDGYMVWDYSGSTPLPTVLAQLASGYSSGAWDGPGIRSSVAAGSGGLRGIGYAEAFDILGGGGGTFGEEAVDGSAVLLRYTWTGDADLNGQVDFDDYVRIDSGFNTGASGWFNGDFDYNGRVDFDDYVLIDLGFNARSATLARGVAYLDGSDRSPVGMNSPALVELAEHFAAFGEPYARQFLALVPEPAGAGVLGLAAVVGRRRRARGSSTHPPVG
jgi:hypothetical protein